MESTTDYQRSEFLPREVIHDILKYVDQPRLPHLALVSRKFQVEAERLLYWSIVLHATIPIDATISCLNTIATVNRKAVFVRSFTVAWWPSYEATSSPDALRALGKALLAMTSLKLLHLRFPDISKGKYATRILNPILGRCTFSITTLLISDCFDLASWIPHQTGLNALGIFTPFLNPTTKQHSVYKKLLQNSPSNKPLTLWSMFCDGGYVDTVYAYPAYSHHWSAKSIQDSLVHANPITCMWRFEVLLTSLSDENILRPVITSISQHFPDISYLRLIIDGDLEIHLNANGVASILCLIPQLAELNIDYHVTHPGPHAYQEKRWSLARTWAAKCPRLYLISFPDGVGWKCGNE